LIPPPVKKVLPSKQPVKPQTQPVTKEPPSNLPIPPPAPETKVVPPPAPDETTNEIDEYNDDEVTKRDLGNPKDAHPSAATKQGTQVWYEGKEYTLLKLNKDQTKWSLTTVETGKQFKNGTMFNFEQISLIPPPVKKVLPSKQPVKPQTQPVTKEPPSNLPSPPPAPERQRIRNDGTNDGTKNDGTKEEDRQQKEEEDRQPKQKEEQANQKEEKEEKEEKKKPPIMMYKPPIMMYDNGKFVVSEDYSAKLRKLLDEKKVCKPTTKKN
jgi:hypothetical protein